MNITIPDYRIYFIERTLTAENRTNLVTVLVRNTDISTQEEIMKYKTHGTCSTLIDIETNGDIIESVVFTGGCNGNLQGIAALVKGMKIEDAITKLKGIKCGFKNTSCPDQLALALEELSSAK